MNAGHLPAEAKGICFDWRSRPAARSALLRRVEAEASTQLACAAAAAGSLGAASAPGSAGRSATASCASTRTALIKSDAAVGAAALETAAGTTRRLR
jgi:hypothetical protein